MNFRFVLYDDIFILDQSGLLTLPKIYNYILNVLNQQCFLNNICSGYFSKKDNIVFIDYNSNLLNDKSIYIINEQLQPKKIYILPTRNRLFMKCKVGMAGENFTEFIGLNGSEMNFSNWGPQGQLRVVIPDLQNKIENDPITGISYGSSIDRTWKFEEPIDHAEWMLQDHRSTI